MIFVNIEAYDAESLRKLVRLLEYENRLLKDKLKKKNIPYDEVNPFEETIDNVEEYDPDQGERIVNPPYITEEMAQKFFAMFWGREDVYAKPELPTSKLTAWITSIFYPVLSNVLYAEVVCMAM